MLCLLVLSIAVSYFPDIPLALSAPTGAFFLFQKLFHNVLILFKAWGRGESIYLGMCLQMFVDHVKALKCIKFGCDWLLAGQVGALVKLRWF